MEDADLVGPPGGAQFACLVGYFMVLILWSYAEYISFSSESDQPQHHTKSEKVTEAELQQLIVQETNTSSSDKPPPTSTSTPTSLPPSTVHVKVSVDHTPSSSSVVPGSAIGINSTFIRCLSLDRNALSSSLPTLRALMELGSIMMLFYVADRTTVFAPSEKIYVRDTFVFILLILTMVAAGFTLKKAPRGPSLLSRQQTEEWKGWMQVFFLLYHYFKAAEVYNAIRICIAAYVWMTGYGNFMYYYKTGDFSIGRFCQMMWRLNFLVTIVCMTLGNSLMAYYICPMHTLWTIAVYATLGIGRRYNASAVGIWTKMILVTLIVAVGWEMRPVFDIVWAPFSFMLRYVDPRRPVADDMHEWYFRSGLDRYVWIFGMICAYLKPTFDKWLSAMDGIVEQKRRYLTRAAVVAATLAMTAIWAHTVYLKDKYTYNALHPYTSWVPIVAIIVLRNLTPLLRTWNMWLYGWLGCITLETYISQYHVWMLTKVPDGQPVYLMTLVAGYPLLNFAVTTAVYVFISHRLFSLTVVLRDELVPHDDDKLLIRNGITMGLVVGVVVGLGYVSKMMMLAV